MCGYKLTRPTSACAALISGRALLTTMSTSGSVTTPPSYFVPLSGDGTSPGPGPENAEPDPESNTSELPAYMPSTRSSSMSRRRENPEPKEFSYDAKNRKGKSIAVLTIIAERSYSKHIPTFLQDSPVKGRVHLDLDKPDTIQSVVLTVSRLLLCLFFVAQICQIRGEYLTGANPDQQLTFLDLSYPLWSQSEGDPRSVNASRDINITFGHVSSVPPARFSGRLLGQYTWPFSITLPKEVSVPCGKGKQPQMFALPQTFNERHAKGSINYEVSLRINRGKFQSDHRYGVGPLSYMEDVDVFQNPCKNWVHTYITTSSIPTSQTFVLSGRSDTSRTYY